jgi:3'-phosphoadenosine 5'-phosphosulfate sulfotransferase (PAPS reductase)/FAD synthetase
MKKRVSLPMLPLFPSIEEERSLVEPKEAFDFPIATTPTLLNLLHQNAPIGLGLSGGADSGAMAFAVMEFLTRLGYQGTVVGIHSDLGEIEWEDSLPMCQEITRLLGIELVTIHTDLIKRWLRRWGRNVWRYANLLCVRLILPWSTPQMRFCTSEEKVSLICQKLVQLFPNSPIISGSGIRWEESEQRKHALICKEQDRLLRKKAGTWGVDWHPIIGWTYPEVRAYHAQKSIPLHSAYTRYGCTRVSCKWCMMGSRHNLISATYCEDNIPVFRRLVNIEIISTFSFQDGLWLGDLAPHLLDAEMRERFAFAKERARRREAAEALIPKDLLYRSGWPTVVPTWQEAQRLATIRASVADAVGIKIRYTEPDAIRARYEELIVAREEKEQRRASRQKKESKPMTLFAF